MIAKHTPGPLTVGANTSSKVFVLAPRRVLDPNFKLGLGDTPEAVACFFGPSETRMANALLYAAAPDLLTYVKNRALEIHEECCGDGDAHVPECFEIRDLIEKATVSA